MSYLKPKQAAKVVVSLTNGVPAQSLADEYKVTYQCIWEWKRYVGLEADWFYRVRELERAGRYAQKHLIETSNLLKIASQIIRQFEPSPRLRGLMATSLRARYDLNRMQANRILGISYSAGSERSVRNNDAALVREMKGFLAENPGLGFSKMFEILLRGRPNSRLHAMKLYREHAMQMQYRRPRSMPKRVFNPMPIQGRPDNVWSMDYMVGALPNGQRFFVLNALDDYNREAMFSRAVQRSSTKAVIEALAKCREAGRLPAVLRTDNGSEFKSKWYAAWTDQIGIQRRYIRPGKSSENAYVESFNWAVRKEVLDSFKFRTLDDVQRMLDDWRIRYNYARPHAGLGGLSPMQYVHHHRSSTRLI